MILSGFYSASSLLKSSGAFWRIWTRKMSADSSSLTLRQQQDGIRINLEKIRSNTAVRSNSASLSAARGPVFSSGHDLKELTSARGREYHSKVFQTCSEVMTLIQDLPVPVIAMVNGVATAAGCQLVASCDIAVATEKSTFATPGINVGLFCSTPGVAIGRALPRKIMSRSKQSLPRLQVAMEMLLTGRPISAQDALLHGLVSKVVSEQQLEEETLAIARRVCESSRPVVALGKAVFHRQMAEGRDAAYARASAAMVENLALRDGQEGVRAFLEKRKPVWSNSDEEAHM
ncbi:Enoyl-CoA hydratase domain-containing protein 3, mitochondrial [Anabarilius grahami]|uniref:Enoyl-CoA hydratase domain-containing protein 3, mitochondrial n=1 Tax=Anabarilius grahami TaxID=495550 RepID=A0A3N0Z3E9_ANAGA|nr:Enoyl-CoA hydratase domain-containing protein 3, mitochondrial [Anabarilius grahami]